MRAPNKRIDLTREARRSSARRYPDKRQAVVDIVEARGASRAKGEMMGEMTEHPNVERFRTLYRAFGEGDAQTIREALADDLVWHVPGRHRFSGDRSKADTMALMEEVVPEFSDPGEPVISTFNIEIESIHASDEWVSMRVYWDHTRGLGAA